ncbi:MAG: peptidylprolyl isomerase [Pseudomonadales bacterium]|jgi:FKBP-type peptidyl-prolyl cis-trans isomerase SlyD|nr:peptidylprolyl isomerase [Pseudomonadales bacterium]
MNIGPGKITTFHFRLSDEEGNILEDSHEREPVAYLHGSDNIVRGLEQAMIGHKAGDAFKVTVDPADGYGFHRKENVQRIPLKNVDVKKNARLKPGMIVPVRTKQGMRQVMVLKAGKFNIDVDANHPYAGRTLTFDVKIEDVREATAEEKSHGHAHGVGGHQH